MSNILKVYAFVALFVIGWWTLAFKQKSSNDPSPTLISLAEVSNQEPKPSVAPPLINVKREQLKLALAGDLALMAQLIVEWDINAQILQQTGLSSVKRLPAHELLRSQILKRHLFTTAPDELNIIKQNHRLKSLTDDAGNTITLDKTFQRYLPQTYISASFLLALVPTDEIVALPRCLREHEQLYPKDLTAQIPLDIDRYNAEKLFQAQPEIAFVAHYSHPATIQALLNQGVILYTMKNPTSIEDISAELLQMGHIINRPFEAELLKIFIDAAMLALDNHLLTLTRPLITTHTPIPQLLFLNHHQNFSIPTPRTISGQLLARMGDLDISLAYVETHQQSQEWMMPIDKEQIINLDPDYLIIAAEATQALNKEIRQNMGLKQLKAVRNNHLYFVDESIQHSPTQYIVLAYFDLIQCMAGLQ